MDEPTFAVVVERLDNLKETVERIEAQTTRTNGRVNKLELWRSMLIGAWIISILVWIPVAGVVFEAFSKK